MVLRRKRRKKKHELGRYLIMPAILPTSQCPAESCMHRRDTIILCWLIFTEGISLHCLQKLIATCFLIVLFKLPSRNSSKCREDPSGMKNSPKKATQEENPFEVLHFILEVLVTSDFYFKVQLLYNKNNILSTYYWVKSNARKIGHHFHAEFSSPWQPMNYCTRQWAPLGKNLYPCGCCGIPSS